MRTLIRMETLKLGKRRMTWILLALLIGGYALVDIIGTFSARSVHSMEARATTINNLTLPGVLTTDLRLFFQFGSIMLAILAASAIGSEYGWGTLRPMISTGVSRVRFLSAKLIALAILAVGFLVACVVASGVFSAVFALVNDHAIFTGTVDAAWVGSFALMLGRTLAVALIPMAIAFFLGTLARSQAIGVGAALGYIIGEQIIVTVLASLGQSWATTLANLSMTLNSQALIGHNSFGKVPTPPGALTQTHALVVLAGYAVVCATAALLIFRRRDIQGAQ